MEIEFILVGAAAFNIKTHSYIVVIYELEEVRFDNCGPGIAGSVLSDGTSKFGCNQLDSNRSTEGCWAPMIIFEICGSFRWSYLWLKLHKQLIETKHVLTVVIVTVFDVKTHSYTVENYEFENVRFDSCGTGVAGLVLSKGTSTFGYKQLDSSCSTQGCLAPVQAGVYDVPRSALVSPSMQDGIDDVPRSIPVRPSMQESQDSCSQRQGCRVLKILAGVSRFLQDVPR